MQTKILQTTGTPAALAKTASRGRWKPAPHLALLNRKLVDLAARRITRLMVLMPPRHGKSELCSHWFPAWYEGTFPHHRTMLSSYEADFAAEWGAKARDELINVGPLFGVEVSRNRRASYAWEIEQFGGGMKTAGIGGPFTGKGADLLIIDDPIKNAEEALSPTIRQKHWDWWQSTAQSRLEPNGVVLVIMTPWHEDDLRGRLLQQNPGEWEILRLPALAEDDDPLGRKPGEALWPVRYDRPALEKIRNGIDAFWWQGLYQGNPGSHGRNEWPDEYFKNIFVTSQEWPDRLNCRTIAIDPSKGKDAKSSDYSAIVGIGVARGKIWVDATVRRRSTGIIVADGLLAADRWKPDAFGVEANQFQSLMCDEFARQVAEQNRLPLPLYEITNSVNKDLRLLRLGPYLARGELRFLDTPDNRLLVSQLRQVPNADHDDGPDALEMAIRLAAELQGATVPRDGLGHNLIGAM